MATPNGLTQAVMLTSIREMPSSNLDGHTYNKHNFALRRRLFIRLLDFLVLPRDIVCLSARCTAIADYSFAKSRAN